LAQTTADAEKIVAEAEGDAKAMRINAEAERYAFQQKNTALTDLLVQQQMIEKWDGKLPTYGVVPQLFKSVTGK